MSMAGGISDIAKWYRLMINSCSCILVPAWFMERSIGLPLYYGAVYWFPTSLALFQFRCWKSSNICIIQVLIFNFFIYIHHWWPVLDLLWAVSAEATSLPVRLMQLLINVLLFLINGVRVRIKSIWKLFEKRTPIITCLVNHVHATGIWVIFTHRIFAMCLLSKMSISWSLIGDVLILHSLNYLIQLKWGFINSLFILLFHIIILNKWFDIFSLEIEFPFQSC